MLPFRQLLALPGIDVSPPSTWTVANSGGSSQVTGNRTWQGQENDGNGYSYLYLPFTGLPGGAYRLSFYANGDQLAGGLEGGAASTPTTGAGPVQFDFRTGGGARRAFVRTDKTAPRVASGILLERLN